MNYVLGWLGLVTISLGLSLVAFVWAVRTGQFGEQQRLRYLPLRDEAATLPLTASGKRPLEVWVLTGIGVVVVAIFVTAVVLALGHG
jgi:cbb3-type cytochrome oxidase maturation protein